MRNYSLTLVILTFDSLVYLLDMGLLFKIEYFSIVVLLLI